MRIQFFRVLAVMFGSFLFLGGCAHKGQRQVCQELDWYEIGRQDGAMAASEKPQRVVKAQCESSDESLAEALYNNGYDAAITESCTAQAGFDLGHSGRALVSYCPPYLRVDFEAAYGRGVRLAQIEKQHIEVSGRLLKLESLLSDKSIEVVRRGLINGEKIQLSERKQSLESEMRSLRELLGSSKF